MDRDSPKVSVVIPTFNRARELLRSIYSVLSQTHSDFELIIVDDCSVDDTEAIVNAISDRRIRYIRLDRNMGGAEARNVGIRMARGDYIAFQDSDDEWTCLKLQKSIEVLEASPAIDGVFSAFVQVSTLGCRKMPIWHGIPISETLYETLLWRNVVDTPTLVVRKSVLEKVKGFDPSMPRYQDWDLALRLANVAELKFLDEPLVLSFTTKGSISDDDAAHADALKKIYNKHLYSIKRTRSLMASWLHRLGDASLMIGGPGSCRLLFHAWFRRPLNIRYLFKALIALPNNQQLYRRIINVINSSSR